MKKFLFVVSLFGFVFRSSAATQVESPPPAADGAVEIAGCVAKPRKIVIPKERELTMKLAITMAGGLTRVADYRQVTLTRKKSDGKSEIIEIDLRALFSSTQDIKLEDGDHIFVPEWGANQASEPTVTSGRG